MIGQSEGESRDKSVMRSLASSRLWIERAISDSPADGCSFVPDKSRQGIRKVTLLEVACS